MIYGHERVKFDNFSNITSDHISQNMLHRHHIFVCLFVCLFVLFTPPLTPSVRHETMGYSKNGFPLNIT